LPHFNREHLREGEGFRDFGGGAKLLDLDQHLNLLGREITQGDRHFAESLPSLTAGALL
jgi:hypothetical protein